MSEASVKRARCATCLRAQSACICRWITRVAPRAALLVLQQLQAGPSGLGHGAFEHERAVFHFGRVDNALLTAQIHLGLSRHFAQLAFKRERGGRLGLGHYGGGGQQQAEER